MSGSTGGWALAIHGGAGVIDRSASPEERLAHARSLRAALAEGRDALAAGEAALDVVERVVRRLEDDPLFNAGRGAVFTADGRHELDASIMDGRTRACGGVIGVVTVRNPISLARLVMERSGHVLLARDGAEEFATRMGVERVDNSYFDTERRRDALERWRIRTGGGASWGASPDPKLGFGTVGAVALDARGDLAAATSTGGMTGKRFGRVGDSPIVGAGTYASNDTCAVSCTGTGEEYIRHAVAHDIAARMRYAGQTANQAASAVIRGTLRPDDGGVIVVSSRGEIAMMFNTEGMYRGAADASGRFDVAIWETSEPEEQSR